MSQRPPHLLLAGYFGFSNTGDEAIFESMVDRFRTLCPGVTLSALIASPDAAKRLGVEPIARKDITAVWKALKKCDVFVQGGGGLFQDSTGRGSVLYYGGLLALAKIACRPSVMFCQGFGPVREKASRWLCRQAFRLPQLITVRDEETRKDLVELGVPRSQVFLVADPALLLEPLPVDEMRPLLIEEGLLAELGRSELPDGRPSSAGPLVAVALRSWPHFTLEPLAEALKQFRDRFKARYLLVPLQPDRDLALSRELADLLDGQAKVLDRPLGPKAMTGVLSCCDMVIGMRLHALILATAQNPLLYGLSYDPKVERFCRRAGALSCPVEGISSEKLVREWEHLLMGRATQRTVQDAAVKILRVEAQNAFEAVLALAKGEPFAEVVRPLG